LVFRVQDDGITHLNIYSGAKTELGRWLSNWAYEPFICEDGDFTSIEGYWYWLRTGDYRFRKLHGFAAKKLGRSLPRVLQHTDAEFRTKIKKAISIKLMIRPDMTEKLKNSFLPLTHYYVYGNKTVQGGAQWIIDYIDQQRKEMNHEH